LSVVKIDPCRQVVSIRLCLLSRSIAPFIQGVINAASICQIFPNNTIFDGTRIGVYCDTSGNITNVALASEWDLFGSISTHVSLIWGKYIDPSFIESCLENGISPYGAKKFEIEDTLDAPPVAAISLSPRRTFGQTAEYKDLEAWRNCDGVACCNRC
jgi:hypothetical protein